MGFIWQQMTAAILSLFNMEPSQGLAQLMFDTLLCLASKREDAQ